MEISAAERWFSVERMIPYVAACQGDPQRALVLYEWNANVGAAFWRTLGHVEELVRNAMHTQLTNWALVNYGDPCWYGVAAELLSGQANTAVAQARTRATRSDVPETLGRVVAELTFAFWRYLVSSRYDRSLWRPALRYTFPGKSRRTVATTLESLHLLRNRIAHHEPIHHLDLAELRVLTLALASWADAGAATWIAGGDSVGRLLRARP